ncbi:hypothetical protein FACS1894217_15180 [Clostridia bacterium]|nr:hypothetical protein FACS1894217_15180 [Clostridia bacterium]
MTLNELEARQDGRAEVFSSKDALNIGKTTQNNLNELQKAVRLNGESLHIIQQLNAEHTPFVVCWHFDGKTWDWGTYCQTLEQAQTVFQQKCVEHGFVESQQARQDGRTDVFYALKENGASDFSMLNTAKTMKLSKQEYSEIKANVNARYLEEHLPAPPDKPSGLTLE